MLDLWICGFVDLWICGFVDLWICGFVDLWICGFVDLWICGFVDLWICRFVDLWICGFVDLSIALAALLPKQTISAFSFPPISTMPLVMVNLHYAHLDLDPISRHGEEISFR